MTPGEWIVLLVQLPLFIALSLISSLIYLKYAPSHWPGWPYQLIPLVAMVIATALSLLTIYMVTHP